jgi:4-hydroxy 2-oxovalerate aldolase
MPDVTVFEPYPLVYPIKSHSFIDVTLRDGGFRNLFNWETEIAQLIAKTSILLGAAYCEVGYAGGVPKLHGDDEDFGKYANLTPQNVFEINETLPNEFNRQLGIMIHPSSNFTSIPFSEFREAGVSLVRFVYHPDWSNRLYQLHSQAKAEGLTTSINIALISRYDKKHLVEIVNEISKEQPNILYFADTCGSLLPRDVLLLFNKINYKGSIGFHAHDYLSMATANSLCAIESGASFIDSSFLGMGRGAGNLRTELWIVLASRFGFLSPNIDVLHKVVETLTSKFGFPYASDWISLVAGVVNLTPPQEDIVRASKYPNTEALKMLQKNFEYIINQ